MGSPLHHGFNMPERKTNISMVERPQRHRERSWADFEGLAGRMIPHPFSLAAANNKTIPRFFTGAPQS
jgi:hypothetical protein